MIMMVKTIEPEPFPLQMLLDDPATVLAGYTTEQSMTEVLQALMAYWKTLEEGSEAAKHVSQVWAKAALHLKAVKSAGPALTTPMPVEPFVMNAETEAVFQGLAKNALVKPNLPMFKEVVKANPELTFEEATVRLIQSMMAKIVTVYNSLVPPQQMAPFVDRVAKTLEFKRKIIIAGNVGLAYRNVWAQFTTAPKATIPITLDEHDAPIVTLLEQPVPKPKKVKKGAKVEGPFWQDVSALCAVVPKTCNLPTFAGRPIYWISPLTVKAMEAFAKKEVKYFQESQHITLPPSVARYNFLMALFAKPLAVDPVPVGTVHTEWNSERYNIDDTGGAIRIHQFGEPTI